MSRPDLRLVESPRPAWWDAGGNDRAMLICRVSHKKQKDGVSLPMQERHARAYVQRVGLQVVCAKPFTETAKKSVLRVQFHAAIEEARRLKVKHLIFYVWDRIARNFTDAEILEELIRDGEITLHVAEGGAVLHSGSDDSEFFLFDITIAQAKQDNRNRRSKTIDGMVERCQGGWYPSRPPAFYFQTPTLDRNGRPRRRGSVVEGPSEEGRRLVRREMELHLEGFSLDRIREKCLEEALVPAKLVATYHRSTIEKHLKQDFYAGIPNPHDGFRSQFTWRGTTYQGKHEPIFTSDEWERLKASFGQKSVYKKLKHHGLFAQGPLSLRCADPACGCKITYAPKTKTNGVTYAYYRCADGKRTHRERGQAQLNVREEDILDQLGSALDAISLTTEIAEAIAKELTATHRQAVESKSKSANVYRSEIAELEEREDRLFTRFDAGEIDRETYDRQLARIRAEKKERFEKLRDADAQSDNAYLVTAERVLELAMAAKSMWDQRNATEKRELLERLVCNPRLDGRNVRFDWKKPFAALAQMKAANEWRPQGDSNPC